MKKIEPIAAAAYFISLLTGILLQGVYSLWPNAFTAVFAPMDQSAWELSKLGYWPCLSGFFLLELWQCRSWKKNHLLIPFFSCTGMLIFSMITQCLLGGVSVAVILLGWVVILSISFYLFGSRDPIAGGATVWLFLLLLWGGAYLLFTFYPPPAKIFLAPMSKY